eukprot:scaffold73_cov252-Pinguiococcus_pyrenoidosus.AAC.20
MVGSSSLEPALPATSLTKFPHAPHTMRPRRFAERWTARRRRAPPGQRANDTVVPLRRGQKRSAGQRHTPLPPVDILPGIPALFGLRGGESGRWRRWDLRGPNGQNARERREFDGQMNNKPLAKTERHAGVQRPDLSGVEASVPVRPSDTPNPRAHRTNASLAP